MTISLDRLYSAYAYKITTFTIKSGIDNYIYPSDITIETRLKKIPDNFTKEFFLEWIQNLNQEYIKHKNLFECYDENGEIVRVKEYRIIQSA